MTKPKPKRGAGRAGDGPPPWYAFVNDAEITATEATGYLYLGEPARAEELFRTALAGALPPRNRALYTARLAVAILSQGRLDDAVTAGHAVLAALATGIMSVRVLEELRPVYDAVKAAQAPAPHDTTPGTAHPGHWPRGAGTPAS